MVVIDKTNHDNLQREARRCAGVVARENRVVEKCVEGLGRVGKAGVVDERVAVFDNVMILKKAIQMSKVGLIYIYHSLLLLLQSFSLYLIPLSS